MTEVPIYTGQIKLDAFLKFCMACETGGEAKVMIQEGCVAVNGETCVQRGRKLVPGDVVSLDDGASFEVVKVEAEAN